MSGKTPEGICPFRAIELFEAMGETTTTKEPSWIKIASRASRIR